uniref:Uncharacterized protein n=1 Tax=Oryza brachyantha TaxID=4533 RepID=J3L9V9_ORYBR
MWFAYNSRNGMQMAAEVLASRVNLQLIWEKITDQISWRLLGSFTKHQPLELVFLFKFLLITPNSKLNFSEFFLWFLFFGKEMLRLLS